MSAMNGSMPRVDFALIASAALARARDLLPQWFPNGRSYGKEFRTGNLRDDPGLSLSINLLTGIWKDFNGNSGAAGRDMISLRAARDRISQSTAARRIADELGLRTAGTASGAVTGRINGTSVRSPDRAGTHAMKKPAEVWELQFPAPCEPPAAGQVRHPKYGTPSGCWVYRNEAGEPQFATYRFDLPAARNGKPRKEVLPYSYGRRRLHTKAGKPWDQTGWYFKRPCLPTPLYGLDRLARKPEATVLVVEGEKTADRAARMFPDLVTVTSQGGSDAADNADWTPLKSRTVVIWPDQDAAGRSYCHDVARQAARAGAASVRIVAVPQEWPDGWDLANELPDGVPTETLPKMLDDARPLDAKPDAAPGNGQATVPLDEPTSKIDRLSRLPDVAYAAERRSAAKQLGIGVGVLDQLVETERAKQRDAAALRQRARTGPGPGEVHWPHGFAMHANGFYIELEGGASPVWICAPFDVLAEVRDPDGEGWGLLLNWRDGDGRTHAWVAPKRLLMVEPGRLEAELVSKGLNVSVNMNARNSLRIALGEVKTGSRAMLVSRVGWHTSGDGTATYILLNGETIGNAQEQLVLETQAENAGYAMAQRGTMEEWRRDVAMLAVGNPIVAFAVCAAFAGPLLDPLGEPSGGFHMYGRSKTGKTLTLRMALSVWGTPRKGGLLRDWRSTANGLEAAAEECSDGLLSLDEIHQADPRDVATAIYSLANEAGKQRLRRDATPQRRRTYRTIQLSTGEIDVASVVAKADQSLPAGADVRLPSINVDDGAMWPNLHGAKSASELMGRLQDALSRCYGRPIRPFIERLAAERANGEGKLERAAAVMRDKLAALLPAGSDPQVQDVARRCALVALAGETAIEWGILPWPKGEAEKAANAVLSLWLARRGGCGSTEAFNHIRAVRAFLLEHGASRFVALRWEAAPGRWIEKYPDRLVTRRAGWRREHGRDATPPIEPETDEYLITPDAWREMCVEAGIDPVETARTLLDAGFLMPGEGNNLAKRMRVPGVGSSRFYVVSPAIFDV